MHHSDMLISCLTQFVLDSNYVRVLSYVVNSVVLLFWGTSVFILIILIM